ncbi:MAG: cytochrome c oxidase assembly protein [Caldilineaceae bacterium]
MPSFTFFLTNWSVGPASALILAAVGLLYARGWRRMRGVSTPGIAARRGLAFGLGWLLLVIVFFSPLFALRTELLLARAIQQILLGLLAAPLLWLGAPIQTLRWGLPRPLRRASTRLLHGQGRLTQSLVAATRPAAIWLLTFCSFLIWADPSFLQWSVTDSLRYAASLWLFLLVYLLFWMHVVKSGPRLHRALHPGIAFFYVLFGGEIPNMTVGVTLAFKETLIYPLYAAGSSVFSLAPLLDQRISGCTIWVLGSVIYVSICLAILGQVFRNEDAPASLPMDWEATQRTIAPGLEHRVSGRRT